ncbi:MAG: FAD/NAD(P)-binding protein [Planctomycetaceae bacterium]
MNAATTPIDNPWLNTSATIRRVIPETPGVATYDIVIDDPDIAGRYTFRPGQFNMIYLPGTGEAAISISGDPNHPLCLPHTIREAGNVTHTLARLGEGCSIGIRGPFGSAWPVDKCTGKDVILVAGGIGMAPLRPVIYGLLHQRERFGRVSVLYGARSADGLLYPDEFSKWQPSIDVQMTVDRATSGWQGHVGVVTALLERLPIARPDRTVLMTCGPEVMMWYTVQSALTRGLRPESIWVSLERNMNCAIGLCGHCQMGPHFVCRDGPVLRYDQVASILKVEAL